MSDDILIREDGKAGRITLNRPQALNALTHEMAFAIDTALDFWRDDPNVALVLIDAAGDRAFCAGGDIRDIYHQGKAGNFDPARAFWRDEYPLNVKIAHYPKPYVALIDGINMGGGVGISCHGSHRIVGDNALIAMPECSIGLIPDVGVSLILARGGDGLGRYMALTGTRVKASDAIHAGFADLYIPSDRHADVVSHLVGTGDVSGVGAFAVEPIAGQLHADSHRIRENFADGDPPAIEARLEAAGDDWSRAALKALRRACPLSAFATLVVIDAVAANPTIEEAVRREFRFVFRAIDSGDLVEGIRAAVIDKDRAPRWTHARFSDVTAVEVARMTGPLGDDELVVQSESR